MMRALCILLVLATAPVPALAGKIYGLVIGVDEYQFITDLNGAVNDARDIADALGGLGAEVTILLDGAASRRAVMREWRRIATEMLPDDQLIVTYAGHGSNEPEAVKGSEQDGRDETLLLAGFSPYGAAAGERIRDDEIADLLDLSEPGQVIFVADACHSGTLSRNLAPSLGFRYVAVDGIKNDPLPPPPARVAERETRDQTALFLAAADDSEKTPEFLIDGKPRGAL
ncbi:caspase family protein, partial [Litoreibacter sp.]|nr:caspase family protein [Litoreibacter sp.]